jgi:hypothetical protein
MSALMDELEKTSDKTLHKYSIDITKEDENIYLYIPIALKQADEVSKFSKELQKIFGGSIGISGKLLKEQKRARYQVRERSFFSRKSAFFTYKGDGKDSTELGTYPPNMEASKSVIDSTLRKTILGVLLKNYWEIREGLSEEEAQKRLDDITPRANKF